MCVWILENKLNIKSKSPQKCLTKFSFTVSILSVITEMPIYYVRAKVDESGLTFWPERDVIKTRPVWDKFQKLDRGQCSLMFKQQVAHYLEKVFYMGIWWPFFKFNHLILILRTFQWETLPYSWVDRGRLYTVNNHMKTS